MERHLPLWNILIENQGPGIITLDQGGWAYIYFTPTSEYTQIALISVSLNDCSQELFYTTSAHAEPQPQLSEISGPTQVCGGSTDYYSVTNSSSSNNNQIYYDLYPNDAGQIDYMTGAVTWSNSYNGTATIVANYYGSCSGDYRTLTVEVNNTNDLWADVYNNYYYNK